MATLSPTSAGAGLGGAGWCCRKCWQVCQLPCGDTARNQGFLPMWAPRRIPVATIGPRMLPMIQQPPKTLAALCRDGAVE
eukprot:1426790-Pyramimonas_sp.AAC.1